MNAINMKGKVLNVKVGSQNLEDTVRGAGGFGSTGKQ